jgi:MFS family permease
MNPASTPNRPATVASRLTAARRHLPILSLLAANAISMVGNVCAAIAIPWFVLQTTGSATETGITGFFTILPVVLAGFFGGALIDRLGYKPTSVIADLASGVTVALIPILHFTIGLQFWELMVLVFLGGLLDAPGTTARTAMIPDLAALADMPLERAASANQIVERGSRLIGAPLAGFLVAVVGTANVLWLDAASFLISAGIVALVIAAPPARPKEAKQGHYFDEIRSGLVFLRRHDLILMIVTIVMITNFVDAAFGGVLLPVYVNRVYGNAFNLGLIIAASGGGAVLGAIVFGTIGPRVSRYATFVAMFVLSGLRFWCLAFFLPFPLVLIAAVISGVAAGPLNPIIDAVLYERIPADMRGRVLGTITAGAWVTMPLGMLLGGILTEQFGVQALLLAMGITYLVTTLSMAFIPVMRELDQRTTALTTSSPEAPGNN